MKILKKIISSLLILQLTFNPLLAIADDYPIIVDQSAFQTPDITRSAGAPTEIDIVPPNNGVSHNKFQEYNVSPDGVDVINQGVNANSILFEVTGQHQSKLDGKTTIVGPQADFYLANPNGITCNGCSFQNTPNVKLTTETPTSINHDGSINFNTPGTNQVNVGRNGLTSDGNVNIKANNLVIDGKINVPGLLKLEATGKNNTTNLAIDGSAYGAMKAGEIKILSNEKGAGVNLKFESPGVFPDYSLYTTGDFTINSNGDIFSNPGIYSDGNVKIDSSDIHDVEVKEVTYGEKSVSINGRKISAISGRGQMIMSGGKVYLTSPKYIKFRSIHAYDVGVASQEYVEGFSIDSHNNLGVTGINVCLSDAHARDLMQLYAFTGTDITENKIFQRAGQIHLGTAYSNNIIELKAYPATNDGITTQGSINIYGPIEANYQVFPVGNINLVNDKAILKSNMITFSSPENKSALVVTNNGKITTNFFEAYGNELHNPGEIYTSQIGNMIINFQYLNNGGIIYSVMPMILNVNNLHNLQSGIIKSDNGVSITHTVFTNEGTTSNVKQLTGDNVSNSGTLAIGDHATVAVTSPIENTGTMTIGDRADVSSVNNDGLLQVNPGAQATITGNLNNQGTTRIEDNGGLKVTGDLNNPGEYKTGQDTVTEVGGTVTNTGNSMEFGDGSQLIALQIDNTGKISGDGNLTIKTAEDFLNHVIVNRVINGSDYSDQVISRAILSSNGSLTVESGGKFTLIGSTIQAENVHISTDKGAIIIPQNLYNTWKQQLYGQTITHESVNKLLAELKVAGTFELDSKGHSEIKDVEFTSPNTKIASTTLDMNTWKFKNAKTIEVETESPLQPNAPVQASESVTLSGGAGVTVTDTITSPKVTLISKDGNVILETITGTQDIGGNNVRHTVDKVGAVDADQISIVAGKKYIQRGGKLDGEEFIEITTKDGISIIPAPLFDRYAHYYKKGYHVHDATTFILAEINAGRMFINTEGQAEFVGPKIDVTDGSVYAQQISILPAIEQHVIDSMHKKKRLFNTKKTYGHDDIVIHQPSMLNVKTFEGVSKGDINISAAIIRATDKVILKAGTPENQGNINISGAVDTRDYELIVKEKKYGFKVDHGRLEFAHKETRHGGEHSEKNVPTIIEVEDGELYTYAEGGLISIEGSELKADKVVLKADKGVTLEAQALGHITYMKIFKNGTGVAITANGDEVSIRSSTKVRNTADTYIDVTHIGTMIKAGDLIIDTPEGTYTNSGSTTRARNTLINSKNQEYRSVYDIHQELHNQQNFEIGVKLGVQLPFGKAVRAGEALAASNTDSTAGVANTAMAAHETYSGVAAVADKNSYSSGIWLFGEWYKSKTRSMKQTPVPPQTHSDEWLIIDNKEHIQAEGTKFSARKIQIATDTLTTTPAVYSSSSDTSSQQASGQIPLYGSTPPDLSLGGANSKATATSALNTEIIADTVEIKVTGKADLSGTNIHAREINAAFGDLFISSVQSYYNLYANNAHLSLNPTQLAELNKLGEALKGLGGGEQKHNRAWVEKLSSIIGSERLEIFVANMLSITGATLANVKPDGSDGGNFKLEAGEIIARDLFDYDHGRLMGGSISLANRGGKSGVLGNSYAADYGSHDKERTVHATIGKAEVTVGGETKTPEQLQAMGVNTDIAKTQEVTRDDEQEPIHFRYTEVDYQKANEALVNSINIPQELKVQAEEIKTKVSELLQFHPDIENIENIEVKKLDEGDLPEIVKDKLAKGELCTDQGCSNNAYIINAVYKVGEDGIKKEDVLLFYNMHQHPEIANAHADDITAMIKEHGLEVLSIIPGLGVVGQFPKHARVAGRAIKVFFKGDKAVSNAQRFLNQNPVAKRPDGIPDNWIVLKPDKGDGIKYVNPNNHHEYVRDMKGNPKNPNLSSQKPYIAWHKDGKRLDVNGNPVDKYSHEAHIDPSTFSYKELGKK